MIPKYMKAAVLYGKEDIRMEEIAVPELQPGDVLMKIGAALTCGTDLKVFRRGYHAAMITPPSVFGHECAGTIVAVSDSAEVSPENAGQSTFKTGDRVVAANSAPCGQCPACARGQKNLCDDLLFLNGAYAEYIRVPAAIVRSNMHAIPDTLSFEDAALAEPLACVVQGLRETPLSAGQTAAVIGLGPIGLMFVGLLKQTSGTVIAVGRRETRLRLAKSLGADVVIEANEFEQAKKELGQPDLIIEATGQPTVWSEAINWVRRGGTVNLFGGCEKRSSINVDTHRLHYDQITLTSSFHHTPDSIKEALDLITRGVICAKDFAGVEKPLDAVPDLFKEMLLRQPAVKYCIRP